MRKALIIALCLAAILCLDVWVHSTTASRLLAHAHLHAPHPLEHAFWDAEPYAAGIADYRAGRSPYHADDLTNPLPFAYPPAFVWTGAALARALTPVWGWRLYLLFYFIAIFGMQILFGEVYLRQPTATAWLALLCLLPIAPFLSTAFLSGNIHVLWYFAAALAAIPGIRRNRWLAFYLVTTFASINQPVFLLLLLFPVLAATTRQYVPAFRTALAIGVAYALEWYANPALYLKFQETIASHLEVSRDFGQGVFGIIMRFAGHGTLIPAAIQILFSITVIVWLVRLKARGIPSDRRWWALIALGIILINPRIMPYDAAQGLIPAIFFLVYERQRGWLITLAVTIACAAAHTLFGFTPVIIAGFAAGATQLLQKPSLAATSPAR